jgi:hypothetical protein
VRTLDSHAAYYQRWARPWEFQALLKARPVAGDIALGAHYVERMAPIVYPDELPPAAIDEVRKTKVRIEEYVRARGKEAVEVKRGRGGIRDVEFAVQLLQLVHGRRDERLREPNTLRALATLADQGYVAGADAAALAVAYSGSRARTSCGPSTSARPRSFAACTTGCSIDRCSRPSRGGPRHGRAWTAPRPRSCWRGWGSVIRRRRSRC